MRNQAQNQEQANIAKSVKVAIGQTFESRTHSAEIEFNVSAIMADPKTFETVLKLGLYSVLAQSKGAAKKEIQTPTQFQSWAAGQSFETVRDWCNATRTKGRQSEYAQAQRALDCKTFADIRDRGIFQHQTLYFANFPKDYREAVKVEFKAANRNNTALIADLSKVLDDAHWLNAGERAAVNRYLNWLIT